jgi:hypothetical protein
MSPIIQLLGEEIAGAGGGAERHDGRDVHAVEGDDELVGGLALGSGRHGFLDGRIGVFLDPGLGEYDFVRYQGYMECEESRGGRGLLSQRPYSCSVGALIATFSQLYGQYDAWLFCS